MLWSELLVERPGTMGSLKRSGPAQQKRCRQRRSLCRRRPTHANTRLLLEWPRPSGIRVRRHRRAYAIHIAGVSPKARNTNQSVRASNTKTASQSKRVRQESGFAQTIGRRLCDCPHQEGDAGSRLKDGGHPVRPWPHQATWDGIATTIATKIATATKSEALAWPWRHRIARLARTETHIGPKRATHSASRGLLGGSGL